MTKTVAQLRVGDMIKVWWDPGQDTITELKPYTGPLLNLLGAGTKLASFRIYKLGMTLSTKERFETIP
jgi:hypothetical protein